MLPLYEVIAAVEAQGARLRTEFHAPAGPRGRGGSCPLDAEIEQALREALLRLLDCGFVGEETEAVPPGTKDTAWIVDPHDGTWEYLSGRRGSAISVALVRAGVPVLGVVHAPDAPDRGPDTIAWAQGEPAILRNGKPVPRAERPLFVWATASAALKPETWSLAAMPGRYVAMPSIAYRMARVAAGDGLAAVSTHAVAEYDIAAGMALVRAAGGVVLDAEGNAIALRASAGARLSGCFAGEAATVARLLQFGWRALEDEPKREARVRLGFPRQDRGAQRVRAQGALLGQVIGDSLGALVEFKPAGEIARLYPGGVRELADGGTWKTIAGQPTDDSEMALSLARAIVAHRGFVAGKAMDAYRDWLTTRPVDIGATTERGLLGRPDADSESNGSLMRVSPLGIHAAGDAALAARLARDDSALTHPNEVCIESCAAYCAAIAEGVGGGSREKMLAAALAHSRGPAREAIERGAAGELPPDFLTHQGWVLIALQNAFEKLARASSFEEALVATVGYGGDTDTNAAIAGALLGALHGRDAIPSRWILPILACRPLAESGALRPRPMPFWPDDVLELAEALLEKGV